MSIPPSTPLPGRRRVLIVGSLVAGALFSLHAGCGGDKTPTPVPESKQIHVQLLAFNDFHGNLEPPTGSNGTITAPGGADGGTVAVTTGGAAYFAAHIAQLKTQNPNTVVVAAGDLIGASPLVSGIFHDEPTVAVMNQIGLDITSVGNHEFDDGRSELLRVQNGGCHPDGCLNGTAYTGAKFKYLSANVFTNPATRETLLPAYEIREFEGVKVAFIGMTLEGTPAIVNPTGITGLTFQDEADTVNALVPELKAQGIEAIVVLIHEGGAITGFYNDCAGVSGAIVDIVNRLDPAVDFIHSGHTHNVYNCVINGRHVTSAAAFGRVISQVDLTLDTGTRDVVAVEATNHLVTRDITPDPTVDAMVQDYVTRAKPLASRVIGHTPADLKTPPRTSIPAGQTGESTLGDAIADAMLEVTSAADKGGAVIAVTNPGGVRADILAGDITYGQAFSTQPFANNVTTLTLTGAQIEQLLEQQFQGTNTRILQVSAGFSYTWDKKKAQGDRVDPASIKLNGVTLDPAASYRVTETNFLASGGDGFAVFTQGKDLLTGPIDVDAFETYLKAHNPLTVPTLNRITALE